MDEYISRQAVLDAYNEEQRRNGPWRFETLIESVPAADVAPVVRCRECIHRDGTPGQPNILCFQMKDDDFCSYGKRR